jgi:hypothetical protein
MAIHSHARFFHHAHGERTMSEEKKVEPKWVYGIWFAHDGGKSDWFGKLFRDGEGKIIFEHRFRYYHEESNNPHDGKDRKNWYTATMEDSEKNMKAAVDSVEQLLRGPLAERYPHQDFLKLECKEDDPKFFFELSSRPWAHVKQMSTAEYEEHKRQCAD